MFELSPLETATNASASLDAGFLEHVAIEPEPDDGLRAVAGGVAEERLGVLVDHDHVVARPEQLVRELGADTATTHDDHSHRGAS